MEMSRRILVVDDDRLVGVNLKLFLEREGFRVDVAHECASARAAVLVGKPDLVLLDIGLPDCSGLDLARWLHTQMRVRFIFLTAGAGRRGLYHQALQQARDVGSHSGGAAPRPAPRDG
jgi:DNA-binding response OmpR family regulator